LVVGGGFGERCLAGQQIGLLVQIEVQKVAEQKVEQ
jgi:hypothetical protein